MSLKQIHKGISNKEILLILKTFHTLCYTHHTTLHSLLLYFLTLPLDYNQVLIFNCF